MNKPVVFLLVVISSLLTYVALGSNLVSQDSEDDFRKRENYRRVLIYFSEDTKFFTEITPSGKTRTTAGFQPKGDEWEFAVMAGDAVIDRSIFKDKSEAEQRWASWYDLHIATFGSSMEVFQVDVQPLESGVASIVASPRQEIIHWRSKS